MPDPRLPLLRAEELLRGWTPHRIGRRIQTLAETDSTNNVALAGAQDPESDGLAVFADFQHAGRGRQGRAWLAPRGASILCSILLLVPPQRAGAASGATPPPRAHPPEHHRAVPGAASADTNPMGRLTLLSAVAVAEAIRRSTDVSPSVKWPNDLRVRGRKLAGILIESRAVDGPRRAWVIGVGVNCYQQPGHFPAELRESATSLDLVSARPIDRTAVARELLRVFDECLGGDAPLPAEEVRARWLALAEPLGQHISVRSDGRDYAGRTLDVDPTGGLILQCDDGQRRWFDPLTTSLL